MSRVPTSEEMVAAFAAILHQHESLQTSEGKERLSDFTEQLQGGDAMDARTICRNEINKMASTRPEFERAVRERYDVSGRFLHELAQDFAKVVRENDPKPYVWLTNYWEPTPERQSPFEQAFSVHDAMVRAAEGFNDYLPKEIGQWTVSRIVRIRACNRPLWLCKQQQTATQAVLETPAGIWCVNASHEPRCEHKD